MNIKRLTAIFFLSIILYPAKSIFPGAVLTWMECVKMAGRNNPELIAAGESVKKYEANVGMTRSPMLPQVSVNSSASKSKTETDFGTVEQNNYKYGIEGSQMLFDGMKTFTDVDKSKEELSAARYRYLATSSDLRLELRGAYISIMKSQENINISKIILQRRRQNFDLVKLRYQAGREHKGSLMTAEAEYGQALYDLKSAERDLEISWKKMSRTIGIGSIAASSVEPDFSIAEMHDINPDFAAISEKNPLLSEMMHLYEAAKYGAKSSKLDFFPRVYGFLNFGRSNNEWPPDKTAWSAGVQATLPLVEGGRGYYDAKRTSAEESYYRAEAQNVRDSVMYTLQKKWLEFQDAADNVLVQEKYLAAAQERSKIAEAQYGIGILSFDNWVIIENSLVSAMKKYLNARTGALTVEAEWIQAKGETLDYDKK